MRPSLTVPRLARLTKARPARPLPESAPIPPKEGSCFASALLSHARACMHLHSATHGPRPRPACAYLRAARDCARPARTPLAYSQTAQNNSSSPVRRAARLLASQRPQHPPDTNCATQTPIPRSPIGPKQPHNNASSLSGKHRHKPHLPPTPHIKLLPSGAKL